MAPSHYLNQCWNIGHSLRQSDAYMCQKINHHWFIQWLVAWSAPSHYLNECWNIVNWNPRNKLQWNINRNSYIFVQDNALENVIWKIAAILSRPQCVNWTLGNKLQWNFNGSQYIFFKKMHFKLLSEKCHPFCLGLSVLTTWYKRGIKPNIWFELITLIRSQQWPWPGGKSQACHAEGPGFAPGTLQGVLFPVAAHYTTLAWQWARESGALFTYHLGAGRPLVAGDK